MPSFINREGQRLAASTAGKETDPTVLLLHGGGQNRHSWDKSAARLAAGGYRAISLDLRGHGDSFWSATRDYDLDAHARDVADVVAALPGRVAIVGASLGGLAAMLVASRDRRVGALVLVDVTPRIEQAGANEIRNFMAARPEGFASLAEAAEAVFEYQPHRERPVSSAGLMRNLRERNGRLHWHWDPAILYGRPRPDVNALNEKMRAAACQIECPVLLVRGGLSRVVSMDGVNELRELIPNLRFVNIDRADHMVAGDDNDAFCEPVLDFLHQAIGTAA